MDTFKQVMGFFLLGTVVFIMSYIPLAMQLPTLAFLVGLWFVCWLIGRIPITADVQVKARTWLIGITVGILFGFVSFNWIAQVTEGRMQRVKEKAIASYEEDRGNDLQQTTVKHSESELPWQVYSTKKLENSIAKKSTVLVDFTADW